MQHVGKRLHDLSKAHTHSSDMGDATKHPMSDSNTSCRAFKTISLTSLSIDETDIPRGCCCPLLLQYGLEQTLWERN